MTRLEWRRRRARVARIIPGGLLAVFGVLLVGWTIDAIIGGLFILRVPVGDLLLVGLMLVAGLLFAGAGVLLVLSSPGLPIGTSRDRGA